jgi:hypothetical protein
LGRIYLADLNLRPRGLALALLTAFRCDRSPDLQEQMRRGQQVAAVYDDHEGYHALFRGDNESIERFGSRCAKHRPKFYISSDWWETVSRVIADRPRLQPDLSLSSAHLSPTMRATIAQIEGSCEQLKTGANIPEAASALAALLPILINQLQGL